MAKSALVVTLRLDGVRDVMRAFRDLPKDANDELRAASLALAETLAPVVVAAGRSEGSQAALVAATVRAQRDRVPVIVAGGTRRLGRNRKPAFKLLFGSEFGSNFYRQFKPHLGSGSYWIFRTVDNHQQLISDQWNQAADRIVRKWAR